MKTERRHLLISGRVQGVGYRFAAHERAQGLGLSGWVRNLPDGRVEALIEGPAEAVEAMIAWCHRGPFNAHVKTVEVEMPPADSPLAGFHIR